MERMGIGHRARGVELKAAAKLWESLVRPVLEYGGALEEGG